MCTVALDIGRHEEADMGRFTALSLIALTAVAVNGDSASVALSEVDKIEVRKGDWVGTSLVVFAAAAGAFLTAFMVSCGIEKCTQVGT
jgi:hypothetical protein